MGYRIDWKSVSQWVGTEKTELEGEEIYATREEAEQAVRDMQMDSSLMEEVHETAVQGQGVEGWLAIVSVGAA